MSTRRISQFEIDDIGFVRSGDNVADGLTNKMKRGRLLEVLTTSKLDVKPEQWIVRDPTSAALANRGSQMPDSV